MQRIGLGHLTQFFPNWSPLKPCHCHSQTVKGSTTIVEGFPQSKAHHPHKVFPLSNFAAELLQALPSFHSKVVMHWSLWCCILLVLDEVDEFLSFNSQ
ncbi:uncharacterized protein LOC108328273 isoform X2 [Vigna angularis]|uniref:uncharacterized protein LOC108328273 isoform X2 n=1 Tax=Phaseolus angularis TaxID=3914 RepID=UPI0022B3B354|nr:uncharacterized protein LOC108328273 isoform X2 [Vigna angularis]